MTSSPLSVPPAARRRFVAVRPLSALAVALVLAGCSRPAPSTGAAAQAGPPVPVRVATVHVEELPVVTEVTGTVRPVQRAQIAAKVMGAIDEMPVTLGQAVHAGDLLVKVSAAEISARVAQAQSQLNAARRDLDRERDLLGHGASTADTVKNLEDRFASAQAMLHEAETMLGYATVRAPFAGVIARKFAQAGDFASPGLPLLELEGAGDFQVEAGVPDSLAAALTLGAPLTVTIPARGLAFTGSLAELSSAADAGARTVLAKISVPARDLVRSGEFARVRLPGAPARALLVPLAALVHTGQLERIFVADASGHAALRLVKTGATHADRIEILSGLDDGERVILSPSPALREGQALEVQR